MDDLNECQKAINGFMNQIINNEALSIKPTMLIIPGPARQYLAEQGYDSEEKIQKLVRDMVMKKLLAMPGDL